jgi:HD-GYP domain-containing protein (c-di-GMP phosphodiesterase class II)
VTKNNFRRFLLTFEALSDLGREMTADREFSETARIMLTSLCEAAGVREAALFTFTDPPAMLTSIAALGFTNFPETGVIPLLPKHAHALASARAPVVLSAGSYDLFLTANGNVAPQLFKCLAPLRVAARLVGVIGLGRRQEDTPYQAEELEAIGILANYIALAVHNHVLAQSLESRIAENLRLVGSLHNFYDNALEAFASAIDIKDSNVHGHSLRVGWYAGGISEATGADASEAAGCKAAGYLHDIGMIAVDHRIWQKPTPLDEQEFRQMADHTVVGHRIVSAVEFPWPKIPEVVRSHHERADGSGYPDHLHLSEIPQPARVVAVADAFDAMTSERPYRRRMSVGEALSELVRLTPSKFDPTAVQGLLVQVRRDATGSNKAPFLDSHLVCNIGPADVDQLAALLQHKLTNGRTYHA